MFEFDGKKRYMGFRSQAMSKILAFAKQIPPKYGKKIAINTNYQGQILLVLVRKGVCSRSVFRVKLFKLMYALNS